jgi:hypothetical protein
MSGGENRMTNRPTAAAGQISSGNGDRLDAFSRKR